MFDSLKSIFNQLVLPKIDLKALGKEALEAVAFVLIDKLKEIAALIPGTLDDELIKKLAEAADKIDGQKDRT